MMKTSRIDEDACQCPLYLAKYDVEAVGAEESRLPEKEDQRGPGKIGKQLRGHCDDEEEA